MYLELETGGYGLRALGAHEHWQHQVPKSLGEYEAHLDLVVCSKAPVLSRVWSNS